MQIDMKHEYVSSEWEDLPAVINAAALSSNGLIKRRTLISTASASHECKMLLYRIVMFRVEYYLFVTTVAYNRPRKNSLNIVDGIIVLITNVVKAERTYYFKDCWHSSQTADMLPKLWSCVGPFVFPWVFLEPKKEVRRVPTMWSSNKKEMTMTFITSHRKLLNGTIWLYGRIDWLQCEYDVKDSKLSNYVWKVCRAFFLHGCICSQTLPK